MPELDAATALARLHPMDEAELRRRIDALGYPYSTVASWLGLSSDGLHKQMRGDRAVSEQTTIILGYLEKERG